MTNVIFLFCRIRISNHNFYVIVWHQREWWWSIVWHRKREFYSAYKMKMNSNMRYEYRLECIWYFMYVWNFFFGFRVTINKQLAWTWHEFESTNFHTLLFISCRSFEWIVSYYFYLTQGCYRPISNLWEFLNWTNMKIL